MWKKNDSGDAYLITKMYSEALATYVVLRKAGAENDPPMRIRVARADASAELPGFTFSQESDEF